MREPTNVCAPGRANRSDAVRAQTKLFSCLATFSLSAFSAAHAESGLASYYGYGKAGKGELTCAHRTRPFGSVLKVSYSGRTIQCRVNDRGPFIRGRIVDLSVPAARALGMMSAGVVRVSVE
nr:septal ring lytic transglycosylase RlpA family protein [Bradyrhizobium sp. 1]